MHWSLPLRAVVQLSRPSAHHEAPSLRTIIASAVMLPTSGSGAAPSIGLGSRDAHCHLRSLGTSTESHGPFARVPADVFEANNKQAWLDARTGFCHLCQEPLGGTMGIHIGDRDHTSLQYFLYLYAAFPRGDLTGSCAAYKGTLYPYHGGGGGGGFQSRSATATASRSRRSVDALHDQPHLAPLWSTAAVTEETLRLCPGLYRYATSDLGMDHLHVMDDAVRRAELEAMLFTLSKPRRRRHRAREGRRRSGGGTGGSGAIQGGSLLPCLDEGPIAAPSPTPTPPTTTSTPALSHVLQGQSPFGFWYSGERMWKMHITRLVSQIYPPASAGIMTNFTQKCWGRTNGERFYDALRLQRLKAHYGWLPYESKEKKAFFVRQLLWELLSVETRPEVDEFTKHLAALAADRMAFEMVFLQSMEFMNRVKRVHELMGRPSMEELAGMNLL